MIKWLIKLLGGIPVSDIQPVVVSPEELAAANPDSAPAEVPVVAVETDFVKVKAALALVEDGVEEAFDDALVIAKKVGGDVEGKLKAFLNVAGFAVPAFDDIVAFIKKHA